jgi:hypothetical protein
LVRHRTISFEQGCCFGGILISMTRVQQLLEEFGQVIQPMRTAPKDGRIVLAYSDRFGLVAVRWIDIGLPKWAETVESQRGFLDRAFTGWYDPSAFRPLREEELARLLVAYIDDMRAEKRGDVLKILDAPMGARESNDNPSEMKK